MLKKEQILQVLKKYGFYSLNRAPYLYQNNEELGVYFVWPNKHYGNLERVLFFEDEDTLDEEIYKYWWFLNHKEDVYLEVVFDQYENLSPSVLYKYKGSLLTKPMMENFLEHESNFMNPKEALKKKQLLRTANILIMILKEKFKVQNDTFVKVFALSEKLKKLTNEYNKKLKEYKNDKEMPQESYELLMDDQDESENLIHALYDELGSLNTIAEVREFINTMFTYLSDLEASESHLQNVYLLNRYPYEIEDMKQKIAILNTAVHNKKKLFKSKQDPLEALVSIDNRSECKKMVNINVYVAKEKKQIIQKYQHREEIDENVLGDYLVNFEKLAIEIPPMVTGDSIELFDKEELCASLKSKYNKLSKKEKSACFVASSFLKDCLNILIEKNAIQELNVNEVISKLILSNQIDLFNDAFLILDNYINAKLRVKYFSILNVNKFDSFISSLIDVIRVLNQIDMSLDKSFNGYYSDKNKGILPVHLKNIFGFSKNAYIATLTANVPLYYSPINIVKQVDILENTELVERENETIFFLKNRVNIQTKPNKLVVVKYEKGKISKRKDYIVVTEVKEKNRCNYYEDVIYNKEMGGFYE